MLTFNLTLTSTLDLLTVGQKFTRPEFRTATAAGSFYRKWQIPVLGK